MGAPLRTIAVLVLACAGLGCADDGDDGWSPGERQRIPLMTGLQLDWELVPHRLSLLELAYRQHADASRGTLTARNDGGSFGVIPGEFTSFDYDLQVLDTTHLVAVPGSLELEIPPAVEHPEAPFEAAGELLLPGAALERVQALTAVLAGFRLGTDEYDAPPAFETDPDLPYDPAFGYTTQGLGIRLGAPERRGAQVAVPVAVRNSLGLADRGDMNAAIPEAATWLRVDVLLLGAFGAGAAVTTGTTGYFISGATYGQNSVHQHGTEAEQRIELSGAPGPAAAAFGITAFDLWLNQEGRGDPTCVVQSDPTNYEGEPISGPGRYVRELAVRLGEMTYEPASGRGEALLDMYLTNSSPFKEVGNICLEARGEAVMVQYDDPSTAWRYRGTVEAEAESGQTETQEVPY